METRTLWTPAARAKVEKRAEGRRVLVGYGAVFYRAGDSGTEYELWPGYVERILPGAFDRALREDDVRGAFNHDPSLILGRTSAGTMRLSVDEIGLKYEIDLPDTTAGRDIEVSVERGDVTGSSFMFNITDSGERKENDVWISELKGIRLYETGPVTFPAYEATTTGMRSAGDAEAKARFEAAAAADSAREQRRLRCAWIERNESMARLR